MRAILCTKYGPPEVLRIEEVKNPVPKDNEVCIKIYATTVSVADTRIRSFNVPLSFWLPGRIALGLRKPKTAILGGVLAGEIESVGKDVKLLRKVTLFLQLQDTILVLMRSTNVCLKME
jgi:NADPH:quinone reductase-like Zn-dependent oxidoreductase